jgi:hypothetical protein
MARLLRKTVALIAAYAIAVQALLTGLTLAAHAGIDPFSVICSSTSSHDQGDVPGHHGTDCDKCVLACGGAPALATTPYAIFLIASFVDCEQPIAWLRAPASSAKHQPRAARAPPILA